MRRTRFIYLGIRLERLPIAAHPGQSIHHRGRQAPSAPELQFSRIPVLHALPLSRSELLPRPIHHRGRQASAPGIQISRKSVRQLFTLFRTSQSTIEAARCPDPQKVSFARYPDPQKAVRQVFTPIRGAKGPLPCFTIRHRGCEESSAPDLPVLHTQQRHMRDADKVSIHAQDAKMSSYVFDLI